MAWILLHNLNELAEYERSHVSITFSLIKINNVKKKKNQISFVFCAVFHTKRAKEKRSKEINKGKKKKKIIKIKL